MLEVIDTIENYLKKDIKLKFNNAKMLVFKDEFDTFNEFNLKI